MNVIYQPRGKAKEYSDLACNLYKGCSHKCKYCYCPQIMRQSLEDWGANPSVRKNILKQIDKDCSKLTDQQKEKELLFCFMSDPYQDDAAAEITRQALLICEKYRMKNVQVLTKAGYRAMNDFDILKRNNWKFGSTIIFKSEYLREKWEEGAPSISSRYEAVKEAYNQGIFTWVSIEPVVNTNEALQVMRDLLEFVDLWKVGKLNHFKKIENTIDWNNFYNSAKEILVNANVYWKKDLLDKVI